MYSWFRRYLNIFFLSLAFVTVVVSVVFVYRTFSQTLTQAEEVLRLQQQVVSTVLNEKLWQEVLDKLEAKTAASVPSISSHPF
jgi:uncharacterized protein YoxC